MKRIYPFMHHSFLYLVMIVLMPGLITGTFASPVPPDTTHAQRQEYPVLVYSPDTLVETLGIPDSAVRQLTISNEGEAPLIFKLEVEYLFNGQRNTGNALPSPESPDAARSLCDESGTEVESSPTADPGKEIVPGIVFLMQDRTFIEEFNAEAGIESDGATIYTSQWNGNKFYVYEPWGWITTDSFSIAGVSNIRDMAYDGTYFYGSDASNTIYQMDFENHTLVGTFTSPVEVRAIAYNPAQDAFYVNNWSSDITLIDREGNVLASYPTGTFGSLYGLAYDDIAANDYLYGFSQDGSGAVIVQYDMPSGIETGIAQDVVSSNEGLKRYAGGCAIVPDLVDQGKYSFVGALQDFGYITFELGLTTGTPQTDAGIVDINRPISGPDLSWGEPITITLRNYGTDALSNIPYEVNWGDESYSGVYAGPLDANSAAQITLPVAANFWDGYIWFNFSACTNVAGDENQDNDCCTKSVNSYPASLIFDNLYAVGCQIGDGLISWSMANVQIDEIPCEGNPSFYHDFTDHQHLIPPGEHALTVQAGYDDTYFDVWIDMNDDLNFTNGELILDDAYCETGETPYTFMVNIPESVTPGTHMMRYRTNWDSPVCHSFGTYNYGNCCDFSATVHAIPSGWLSLSALRDTIEPGGNSTVDVTLKTANWNPGEYQALIRLSNTDPYRAVCEIPVTLHVTGPAAHFQPVWETPYNPMTIFAMVADIDGMPMLSGGEIGLFDLDPSSGNEICVGTGRLTQSLEGDAYLEMVASMDDGSGAANGFTPGHALIPRLWNEIQGEVSQVNMIFPYPANDTLYAAQGTAFVEFHGSTSVGMTETAGSGQMQVSPNPASNHLILTLNSGNEAAVLITLTDSRGQTLMRQQKTWSGPGNSPINLDVNGLSPGLYLLIVKDGVTQKTIGTEKIILH